MTAKPWPWICLLLAGWGGTAAAAEVCDIPPRFGTSPAAIAIVRSACNEHRLWQRPFIDSKGKLASLGVTEAESASLADDGMIAWQRVAGYWRDSGTLASMGAARARPAAPPSTAAATPPVIAAHSWSTILGRPPSFRG